MLYSTVARYVATWQQWASKGYNRPNLHQCSQQTLNLSLLNHFVQRLNLSLELLQQRGTAGPFASCFNNSRKTQAYPPVPANSRIHSLNFRTTLSWTLQQFRLF